MPVGSTLLHSVQVLGFSDIGHLTLQQRLNRFLFVRPAFFAFGLLLAGTRRFHLAMNTLAVQLALPLAGCAEDFHLQVIDSPPQ